MPGDDEPFTCSACAIVVAPPAKRARLERDKRELERMKRRLAAAPAPLAVPAVFAPPPSLEELLPVPFQDAVAML